MTDDDLLALVKRVDPRAVRLPPGLKAIAVAIQAAERKRCLQICRMNDHEGFVTHLIEAGDNA